MLEKPPSVDLRSESRTVLTKLFTGTVGLLRQSEYIVDVSFDILSMAALFLVPRICSVMSLNPYFGSLVRLLSEGISADKKLTLITDSCAEGDGKINVRTVSTALINDLDKSLLSFPTDRHRALSRFPYDFHHAGSRPVDVE